MVLGVLLMVLQQFSGINGVVFNMKSLFDNGSSSASYVSMLGSILVNAVQVIATAGACTLMERVGRRTFLLSSCVGMALSCSVMAVAVYYSLATYVKIFALFESAFGAARWNTDVGRRCGYMVMFAFGVGPLPWLLCSEIYPSSVRAVAMSLSTVTNWACSFLVTLLFDDMVLHIGQHGVFVFYAAVCLAGAVFFGATLPETRGLSLEQIEELWK